MESTVLGVPTIEEKNLMDILCEEEKIAHRDAILKAGLEYLEKGLSVIPLSREKRPLVKWDEYSKRLATKDEFMNWFGSFEDMQLGIVTGKLSGIAVIDLEAPGVGKYEDLPEFGPMYKTGKGGHHYWVKFNDGIKNGVRVREEVDLRGEKGYVVVPPSKSTYGDYEWVRQGQMMNFPAAFLPQRKEFVKQVSPYGNIEDYQGCSEGGRNDSMTRYAGKILPEIHGAEWEIVGWPKFLAANQLNNPPLPEDELRRTWESIKSKELSNPSLRKPKTDQGSEKILNDDGEEIDDSLRPMRIVAEMHKETLGDPIPTGIPSLDDALKDGIRPGDLISISGESGHGKSTLGQTISANIAELGMKVLFFTYEVTVNEMWDKFNDMNLGEFRDLIITPTCHSSRYVDWLKKKILEGKKEGIKVVVIDHLEYILSNSKHGKNISMNFSNKISETVKDIKDLARNEGIVIILMFHLRKVNQGSPTLNDAKDSSSIIQESDAAMIIERNKNQFAKENGGEFFLPTSTLSLQKNRRSGGKTFYKQMAMINGRLVEIGADGNKKLTDFKSFAAREGGNDNLSSELNNIKID